uniref:39S ribosomal protein L54, mitochondrial n=1 Tax=Strongyloides papillosus TaxID=174720 RepID=A0A0N5CHG7_STREA
MNRLFQVPSYILPRTANIITRTVSTTQTLLGPKVQAYKVDKSFVETDAEKLCKYVCINYLTEVKEPGPEIKPDSEYPAWLFELDLSEPRELEDMDPDVDGWMYYRTLLKRYHEQNRRIRKLKARFLHIQDSPSLKYVDGNTKRARFTKKSHPFNCS